MNSVQLIGRLTRDPTEDRVADGTAVATFRLAVDRPGGDSADFVTVKMWDRLAEVVAEHLSRGRRVAVEGRLFHDEWTDDDGQRGARLIVIAYRVEFLDPPAAADPAEAGIEAGPMEDGRLRTGAGRA